MTCEDSYQPELCTVVGCSPNIGSLPRGTTALRYRVVLTDSDGDSLGGQTDETEAIAVSEQ